ncbi:MAG TPA: hypothetical protein VD999_06810 [Vitreimonas sp.]|nr:hypothetical protein [Vitreimonas sp.]
MYQTIHEKIDVIGVYSHSTFKPVKFQWRDRVLKVEKITSIADIKDGGVKRRLYSVLVKGNLYRLLFHRDGEFWMLEEVWVEEGV